ncbi:50S ribosomal protein L3 [Candidatus Kinetoplastibacterium sorsogonicusi]|uniref:Large ribosomal subunit protein uL3 n=1 Tax=Candidatus Kinetoplastidibacterium kentomonadis TaxID=1576550 RepID=A0A3Q8F725_9PROT|nr:50S ribosomal protein L3 [Candidatus Kinetoplastibacterium sorsogonicusi]AWD32797.1 50S ribosomal protein L3 [Candidatus Kinetoplastibacterium sorsogonicusi]
MLNQPTAKTFYKLGLLGRKIGMTRIFTDDGESIPVTVLDVSNNHVIQSKSLDVDGYIAVQVSYGQRRLSRVTKPLIGHYAKAGVTAGNFVKEFRLNENSEMPKIGSTLNIDDIFSVGQQVDITGTTIGKGFAGTIKRHNFGAQRTSHGNSRSHRVPGSIGQAQDPGRVLPGKRMSGHLGSTTCTVQNLKIIKIDTKRGLILVKGAVPGHIDSNIIVRHAIKKMGESK